MKSILLFVLITCCNQVIYSQIPSIQWQQCYGTSFPDEGTAILNSADNGFIVAVGWKGDYCGSGNGSYNGGVLKLDANGNLLWHSCLELPGWDESITVQNDTQGGYIVLSATDSNAYDFVSDPDIMKLNEDGSVEWNTILNNYNIFGYMNWNELYSDTPKGSIVSAYGSGYMLGGNGHPNFFNLSTAPNSIITNLDSTGNVVWQASLGGSGNEMIASIQQTLDGNYIFAGTTSSNDGDVTGNHGLNDFWIVKIDPSGSILWQKCLGGSTNDFANAILSTSDGGYVIAGTTNSIDGNAIGNHGGSDALIIKLDAYGTVVWQQVFGGSNDDTALSICDTPEGGYIFSGSTNSNDGDVSGNHGASDAWVVKLDARGTMLWQSCLGGSGADMSSSIKATPDNGYVFTGSTESNDGDVSGNHGFSDIWVVKLDASALSTPEVSMGNIRVYPNPVDDTLYFSEEVQNIMVYTIDGKLLLDQRQTQSIAMDRFSSGIYVVKIDTLNGTENIQVIKK